jgi:Tfp pilus assembly protein PilO
MGRHLRNWKTWIRWGLAGVLALDLALVFLNWRHGSTEAQMRSLEELRRQHALFAKDVRHAQDIEKRLPEIRRECDEFFEEQLRPADVGYSDIVADIGQIAAAAGLRTSAVTFQQQVVENRGVVQVEMTAAVEGDYASLVRFINGLERSKSFYLMDKLVLASSTGGSIKLTLELRTYFRS